MFLTIPIEERVHLPFVVLLFLTLDEEEGEIAIVLFPLFHSQFEIVSLLHNKFGQFVNNGAYTIVRRLNFNVLLF